MQAFKIKKNGKILDYRRNEPLDLERVKKDLSKKFKIIDIRQPGRHAILTIDKNGTEYILKLSSTEGISARTETETIWNDEYNKHSKNPLFRVPKNIEDGYYGNLYYLIIEKLDGKHLSTLRGGNNIVEDYIESIVKFSEHIQTLDLDIPNNDLIDENSAQKWFIKKTKSWLDSINSKTIEEYELQDLLEFIKSGAEVLTQKPRHGDFTPWHLLALKSGGLGLIDGEHAHSHGVEYYDIAYFVQRIFSLLDRRDQAELIIKELKKGKVDIDKLKTVLMSRAIGGFCDEYLSPVPNYEKAKEFSDFILKL